MKEILIQLLETLNYPVYLQGSYPKETKYPDSFFTFWNLETPESSFYDNEANKCIWSFWIYFYSNDPTLVNTKLEEARTLLKTNGFISNGKGEDVASDFETHTGRMIEVSYIEKY